MKNELRMRAVEVLQKEFGDDWQEIAQSLGTENLRRRVGKDLTSFVAFPDRGHGEAAPGEGIAPRKWLRLWQGMLLMPSVITERAFRISHCSTRCRAAAHPSLRRTVSEYARFCMT